MWNRETICIEMSFIMQRLRRDDAAFHRRAAPLHRHHPVQKGIVWKTLLCWCEITAAGLGSDCFHKDGHCTLKAAASVFVSWHSRVSYMHTHTHTRNDSAYHIVLFAPFLGHCCASAFSTHDRKYPSSQVWDECSQKEGKRQIAKRKGEQKGKWLLVWREKKEAALQREWGVHLICNYLPPLPRWSAGVWSWLASWSLLWRKVVEGLWPLPTSGRAPRDLRALDARPVRQPCNPSLSDVRQQMSLPVGSILPGDPWPRHHAAQETQRSM